LYQIFGFGNYFIPASTSFKNLKIQKNKIKGAVTIAATNAAIAIITAIVDLRRTMTILLIGNFNNVVEIF